MSQRRYHLHEPAGRGSFGTVYRATLTAEMGFAKEVALKILKPEVAGHKEITSRLRDEARLLGLLRHRAIVQVDGLVKLQGRWAVVMEYVEGVNLREAVISEPIPVSVALEIVAEIASALHLAYSQRGPDGSPLRLVHRDIKPSNIRITASGDVKVLDFGIARAEYATREADTSSLLLGSFGYMSPERLDAIDGPEGDIYALGVVFFEVVVAKRLGRTSASEVRHAELRGDALERFAGVVGPEAAAATALLGRMLAYRMSDRPTARDLEVACRRVMRQLHGESLAEWAERVVPEVAVRVRAMDNEPAEMSGQTLEETWSADTLYLADSGRTTPPDLDDEPSPARATPPPAPPVEPLPQPVLDADELPTVALNALDLPEPLPDFPPPRPPPEPEPAAASTVELSAPEPRNTDADLRLAVLGVLLVLVLAGVGLMLAQGDSGEHGDPTAPPPVEGPSFVAPPTPSPSLVTPPVETLATGTPEASPTPELPEVEPPPVEPPPVEPRPVEQRPVETRPVKPPSVLSPPAPPPQVTGTVVVSGDPAEVVLFNASGRYPVGSVPSGAYTIEATFEGKEPVVAGQIVVGEGTHHTLVCRAAFRLCSGR